MKNKFLNRFAALAFAALLCVATNAAFAQSRAGDTSVDDPVSVHQREQRAAATITNPGTAVALPSTKSIETNEPAAEPADAPDAAVMAAKPQPSSGKIADEVADMNEWVASFTRWYNNLSDPYLYLSKQQVDWFSTGDWKSVYHDMKNTK